MRQIAKLLKWWLVLKQLSAEMLTELDWKSLQVMINKKVIDIHIKGSFIYVDPNLH